MAGINANVTNNQITASVGESKIDVAVSGGVGPTGSAATVSVGTVTTGAAGSQASVTNVGTSSAAVLNFTIPAGAAGAAGATGATGAAGAAATVSVGTVTTGAAGSSASITNVGTSSAAVFNFTIPAGATGATGATGAAGSQGAKGDKGDTGDSGVAYATAPVTYDSGTKTVALSIGAGLTTTGGALVLGSHTHATSDVTGLDAALSGINSAIGGKAAATHASQHAAGGSDPVTVSLSQIPVVIPESDPTTLGDATEILYRFASEGWTGAIDALGGVPWSLVTSVPSTFAPSAHKSSHAAGGSDAISPSEIGAAAVSHAHSAADITSGTVATARLGSGTASSSTFLRGDGTWASAGSTSASDLTSGTLNAARLPSTTVTAASYGSASAVATFTVDATGRLTAAGSTTIAIAAGAVSGLATIATSGSASDLSAGTVPIARLPTGTTSTTVAIGNHTHAASDIASGVIATARLASSGTASATTFLRGDQTWATAGSSSASDLTSGTLSDSRLSANAQAAINLYLWSAFR